VVVQVAMSLVLACAAALMAQSVWRLIAVDPGFDADGIVTVDVLLPRSRYATEAEVAAYHRELAARLEADAEIERVSAATTTPLDGNDGCSAVYVEGRTRFDRDTVCLDVSRVAANYFDVFGIRVRGRVADWTDAETGAVIVSESAARRLWPGEDPIGKGLRVNGSNPPYYRVAAVAEDVRRHGLNRPPAESVYFPLVSLPDAPVFAVPRFMRLVLRTDTRDESALIARVRAAMTTLDPAVPMANPRAVEDLVAQSMARSSLAASLLTLGALLAVVLSAVGLYGVISYGVASRKRELGVRLAIGARPAGIRGMVLRETLTLVLAGLVLGAFASLSSARLLEGLLFGVEARDGATLAGVSAVLLLTGIAAGALPAWRASGTDPLRALRCE
jgi:predicted permease